jgi:hypothetical protein
MSEVAVAHLPRHGITYHDCVGRLLLATGHCCAGYNRNASDPSPLSCLPEAVTSTRCAAHIGMATNHALQAALSAPGTPAPTAEPL